MHVFHDRDAIFVRVGKETESAGHEIAAGNAVRMADLASHHQRLSSKLSDMQHALLAHWEHRFALYLDATQAYVDDDAANGLFQGRRLEHGEFDKLVTNVPALVFSLN